MSASSCGSVAGVRVAAVDLGTNTTRLLVADVARGRVETVARRETITRMGESVDRRRILLPTAVARVRKALDDYRREAARLAAQRLLAVGTSAIRDAANGGAFLGDIEERYGFTTRMLDGAEEAALMLRGVASDRPLSTGTLVVDIGGGSTEPRHGRQRAWPPRGQHGGRQRPPHRTVPRLRPSEHRRASTRAPRPSDRCYPRSSRARRSASPAR